MTSTSHLLQCSFADASDRGSYQGGRELFARDPRLWLGHRSWGEQGLHVADLAHPPKTEARLAAGTEACLAAPDPAKVIKGTARAVARRSGALSTGAGTGSL
jgi:hypothetical protein